MSAAFERLSPAASPIFGGKNVVVLAPTAGGKTVAALESELGEKVTSGNLYLRFKGDAAKSEAGIHSTIDKLRGARRPNGDDALRFAADCARTRLSKFEPCLPDRLTAAYMADVLTDPATAAAALGAPVTAGAK